MTSTKLLVLAALMLAPACASSRSASQVDGLVGSAWRAAMAQQELGNESESFQLAAAVARIDPGHPGAAELMSGFESEHETLFDHPYLGSNFKQRPEVDRSIFARVLLYLPDRVLDMADVFSFDVHFGLGAYANVHVTRALQAGGGFRAVGGIGWHDQRSLGLQSQSVAGVAALGLGTQAYGASMVGTSGVFSTGDAMAGLHRPSMEIYQEYLDYWAIGASVTAGIVGVDFDFHPIELVDALLGFTTLDILNDDFGRTRGLRLTSDEHALMSALGEVESRPAEWDAYNEWIASGRPGNRTGVRPAGLPERGATNVASSDD
jgi:hypothetical protein